VSVGCFFEDFESACLREDFEDDRLFDIFRFLGGEFVRERTSDKGRLRGTGVDGGEDVGSVCEDDGDGVNAVGLCDLEYTRVFRGIDIV
jgi:hypothetical protein